MATTSFLAALGVMCAAQESTIKCAIPPDAVAVLVNQGSGVTGASAPPRNAATTILRHAGAVGLLAPLDLCTRGWLDALDALTLLSNHPHAFVVLDVSAEPNGQGGSRLAGLSAAVVVDTGSDHRALEQRVQSLLARYSNSVDGTLTRRDMNDVIVHELIDRRLPEWALITWCAKNRFFIAGIGPNAAERVAWQIPPDPHSDAGAAPPRGVSPTMNDGGSAHSAHALDVPPEVWSGDAFLLVNMKGLADRLGPSLRTKVHRTREALGLHDADSFAVSFARAADDIRIRLWRLPSAVANYDARPAQGQWGATDWASPKFLEARGEKSIPKEATFAAIFNVDALRLLRMGVAAFRAARSPRAVSRAETFWGAVQSECGVDIERDILARLGRPWIVHDYPRHALSLPLAWTLMIPVEGDAVALRAATDRLFAYASHRLEVEPVPPWNLRRYATGAVPIWHVEFGLNGPGLAVTDRWVIVSFSPVAVAQNVAWLSRASSSAGSPPTGAEDAPSKPSNSDERQPEE